MSKKFKLVFVTVSLFLLLFQQITYAETPVVKVQVETQFPPFRYVENGSLIGFDIDFLRLIFNENDYKINFSTDEWTKVYENVKEGNIDTCGLIASNEERKKDIIFTKPVYKASYGVYSKYEIKDLSIDTLGKYKIGVSKGHYGESLVKDTLGIKNYTAFSDVEKEVIALNQGKVDVIFDNQMVIEYFLIRDGLKSKITERLSDLYPTDLSFGVKMGEADLVAYMNTRINMLQKSGVYEELYQHYFHEHSPYYEKQKNERVLLTILFILIGAVIIFLFLQIYIRYLKNKMLEERYFADTVFDNGNIMMLIWKMDGTIVRFNKYSEDLTGFSENDIVGKKWIDVLVPEEILEEMQYAYEKIIMGELTHNHENKILCKDGRRIDVLWNNSLLNSRKGNYGLVLSMGIDITERKLSEEKINYMAYYDGLTGLPNRTSLLDSFNLELIHARKEDHKMALLFLDLDDFKNVNDTLGHSFGDEILKKVGCNIRNCIRDYDVVARFGADEYIILLTQVEDIDEVTRVAAKIIELFNQPILMENRKFYITTSIGISVYPNDGYDIQTLLRNSDTAMYKAKELGKNNYQIFTQSMNIRVAEKIEMENSLRRAIEKGEFVLYYQPQIDIESKRISGMEALIRWMHPTEGIIPPLKFIPVAEESNLIIPIGEWVIKTACEQNKAWQDAGYEPHPVAVNLSARQFQQQDLVEIIERILASTGLSPEWLEIEITESLAMLDLDMTVKILTNLKKLGIKISLDDFGTGYSSLNYLKSLPINTLKIDKSFVHDITENSSEEAIAKAVISMAHSMKLSVTAEGVETEKQLEFLEQQHCDKVQGYYFSKPLPVNEFEKMLEDNRKK